MKYKTNEIHICLKVNIVYVVCLENIFIVSTVLYFLLNEAKYKAVICFSAYSCMYHSIFCYWIPANVTYRAVVKVWSQQIR